MKTSSLQIISISIIYVLELKDYIFTLTLRCSGQKVSYFYIKRNVNSNCNLWELFKKWFLMYGFGVLGFIVNPNS